MQIWSINAGKRPQIPQLPCVFRRRWRNVIEVRAKCLKRATRREKRQGCWSAAGIVAYAIARGRSRPQPTMRTTRRGAGGCFLLFSGTRNFICLPARPIYKYMKWVVLCVSRFVCSPDQKTTETLILPRARSIWASVSLGGASWHRIVQNPRHRYVHSNFKPFLNLCGADAAQMCSRQAKETHLFCRKHQTQTETALVFIISFFWLLASPMQRCFDPTLVRCSKHQGGVAKVKLDTFNDKDTFLYSVQSKKKIYHFPGIWINYVVFMRF